MVPLALGTAATPSAADGRGLSSIVISKTLPGMAAFPPGPFNGPMTSDEVNSFLGDSGTTNAFSQAIAAGRVKAYVRMWSDTPPDGVFVVIVAAQFPNSFEASAALSGAAQSVTGAQITHFAVPEIPHAVGVTGDATTQAGSVSQAMVVFAKGSILFDVVIGHPTAAVVPDTSELDESNAIQVAVHQDASAPGPPVAPCHCGSTDTAYRIGQYVGAALLLAGVIWLVAFLVRRSRRADTVAFGALWPPPEVDGSVAASPTGVPGSDVALAAGTSPARAPAATAVLERPAPAKKGGFHCRWCGEHLSVGEDHDCGRRGQPATHCMRCGTEFAPAAKSCAACGSPKL